MRRVLAFLLATVAVLAEEGSGSEPEEENTFSDGPGSFRMSTSLLGIVTTLVVVTIVFEYAKEHIIEHSTEQMREVVAQMFSELTVLGFLSLCTFLISKAGVLDTISRHVFCSEEVIDEAHEGSSEEAAEELEECTNKMSELFESCHMLLFGIMILFIIQVLNLLRIGRNTERYWSQINKECQDRSIMGYCTRSPIANPSAFLEHLRHEDGSTEVSAHGPGAITAQIVEEQERLQAHALEAEAALGGIEDEELREACVAAVRHKVREHAADRKAARMHAMTAAQPGVCGTARTCMNCLNDRFKAGEKPVLNMGSIQSGEDLSQPLLGGGGGGEEPVSLQDKVMEPERFPAHEVQEAEFKLEFQALRAEFVHPRGNLPPYDQLSVAHKLPHDFDYGRYLSMCLGRELAEVVELPVTCWLALEALVAVYYLYMLACPDGDAFEKAMMAGWLFTGYLLMGGTLLLRRKVLDIRRQMFVPSITLRISDRMSRARGKMSMRSRAGRGPRARPLPERKALDTEAAMAAAVPAPAWTSITVPDPSGRSSLRQYFMGKAPNAQEMLFWLEHEGPEFHLFLVRLLLVMCSVYVAIMGFQYATYADRQYGVAGCVVYVILALVPIVVINLNISTVVREVVHVSCVGLLRRPQVIKDVIRMQKTEKALKSLRLLSQMRRQYQSISTDEGGSGDLCVAEGNIDLLEPAQREHLEKTFRMYDKDGSGEVDASELRTMMASLGQQMDDVEAEKMLGVLDTDGDGSVSLTEFLQWNAAQLADPVEISPEDLAKSMFQMFLAYDTDGSGCIGIAEFIEALEKFGCQLDVDEVADLVRELDEDGDGEISEHEFADLLRRHAISDLT